MEIATTSGSSAPAGPSRGAWAALSAAWFGWVLDAFDFSIFLLVMPTIAKEFGVAISSTALSVTLTLLVRLLGSFVAGAAADRWGRKLPLMISIIWFATCDGLVAFAPSFTVVIVLRILFGFGMGAEWTAGATLAMEAWPEKSRGFASGVLQAGWAVGYLCAAIVYALVMPLWGWRTLFLIAALPALIVLPIRFFVPETKVDTPTRDAAPTAAAERSTLAMRVVMASFVLTFGFAIYFGLTTLYPTLLQKEHGFDEGAVGRHVAAFNVGMLIAAPLCGWLASKVHPLLAIAGSIAFVPLTAPLAVGLGGPALMLPGAFLVGAFAGGPSGVTPVWLSSLFPASFRARGTGLCYHLAAFAAAFTPFAAAAIAERGFGYGNTVAAVVSLLAVLEIIILLVIRRRFPQAPAV